MTLQQLLKLNRTEIDACLAVLGKVRLLSGSCVRLGIRGRQWLCRRLIEVGVNTVP